MEIVYVLLTGVLAGIASGVFGIGGGVILIPILVLLFKYPQVVANGTSLVALLLPVGIFGVLEYYKASKISGENIRLGLLIAVGMFVGTYLGAKLAVHLPVKLLTKMFSVFLIAVALKMFFAK
ncbi:MAG: TSUP family transporter [Myxococcaceae bacterium]